MKTIFKLSILTIAISFAGIVNAQQTTGTIAKQTESAPASGGNGSIRLIDNKGTIKYLQAANGVTMLTNATGDVTTTTWQLGGTLSSDTFIDVNGNVFGLNGLELIDITTEAASTDATTGSDAGTGTGWTVVVRDENTGTFKKILASDLLQVEAGQVILEGATLPTIATATAVAGLPATTTYQNVSVYRNGAKLLANRDYTIAASNITLVDQSSATPPNDWTLYASDIIEIHWVK